MTDLSEESVSVPAAEWDAMKSRLAHLEARLDAATPQGVPAVHVSDLSPEVSIQTSEPVASAEGRMDRRRLLGRAGTAAVGAVLGGTAIGVATASPAAAATGTFDTSTATPALTATTSSTNGGGVAISAVSTGAANALEVTGNSMMTAAGNTLVAKATGPNAVGIWTLSDKSGAILRGSELGAWLYGETGAIVSGTTTHIWLRNDPSPSMPPPPTRDEPHDKGELYRDDSGTLWLCTADGTPGTWSRIGGAGTAGAFTVLGTPVRVYDTRAGSGKPGAGTGPVLGVRHGIDLTANSSGLPADATAGLVTLTVTNTVANPAAYGQIYADGLVTPPGTSVINWTAASQTTATTTTTALTAGKVAISMNAGANVLIDVIGYYR